MPRRIHATEASSPFQPHEASPLELYTPAHGNILAMMAEAADAEAEDTEEESLLLHGEAVQDDHAVAASLPVDHSVIEESGHMDHHRKPIISVHGKDVDEHDLDHKNAA